MKQLSFRQHRNGWLGQVGTHRLAHDVLLALKLAPPSRQALQILAQKCPDCQPDMAQSSTSP